jgi:hypothetical protein
MNRREFLVRVGGTLVAVPFVLEAVSCGSDNSSQPQANATSWSEDGNLVFSHTHRVTFQCTDLASSADKIYTSTAAGMPTHTHTLTLTPAELAMIASGSAVTKASNTDTTMHAHMWVVQKPASTC